MPGGRGMGIRSLYLANDVGGERLKGEIDLEDQMPRVQERPSEGFTGYALTKPARCGKGSFSTGGRSGCRGQKSQDLPDGVPDKGRAKSLPI